MPFWFTWNLGPLAQEARAGCVFKFGGGFTSLLDDRRCMRTHDHEAVICGSRATARAGRYPAALARSLVKGMERQV